MVDECGLWPAFFTGEVKLAGYVGEAAFWLRPGMRRGRFYCAGVGPISGGGGRTPLQFARRPSSEGPYGWSLACGYSRKRML